MIGPLRAWAETYRDRGKYTPVGTAFHWTMAALVIYQLYTGWAMQRLLTGGEKLEAYRQHSEIGLLLLVLGLLRLLWRLMVPGPINDADAEPTQAKIAHATHAAFYVLFAVIPISGWMLWSAIQPAEPLSLAGLVPVPTMPFQLLTPEWQFWVLDRALDIHVAATVVLTLLALGHAAAAIKHHFWDRDDVLEGMLPEIVDTDWHPGGPRYSPPRGEVPSRPTGG